MRESISLAVAKAAGVGFDGRRKGRDESLVFVAIPRLYSCPKTRAALQAASSLPPRVPSQKASTARCQEMAIPRAPHASTSSVPTTARFL